jgi:hypothetical protein
MAAALLMLPANRAFNGNGVAEPGAVARLYTTGTTTPQPFYSDSGLSVSLGTTLTANGAGRFATPAYQDSATPFRLIIEDADGVELEDIDPFYFGTTILSVPSATFVSRTAMAAQAGTAGANAYLSEAGREGEFVWKTAATILSEYGVAATSLVSSDAQQGLFVPPTSGSSGASGAWVRKFSGKANARWWGLTPGAAAAANTTALQAAVDMLEAIKITGHGYVDGSIGLYIPAGVYNLNGSIQLAHSIHIEGDSNASPGGSGTVLVWAAGSHGIEILAGAAKVKKLALYGGYTGANPGEYHGIRMRWPCEIEDCHLASWQGDGINGHATSAANGGVEPSVGNINGSKIDRVFCSANKNGIYLKGADASACVINIARVFSNREYGIYDESFLGNTYTMPEASGNVSGAYCTVGDNQKGLWLNPYSESDQPASVFAQRNVIINGLLGSGITGQCAHIYSSSGYTEVRGGVVARDTGSTTLAQLGSPTAGYFGSFFHSDWANSYYLRKDTNIALGLYWADTTVAYAVTDEDHSIPHTFYVPKLQIGNARIMGTSAALPTTNYTSGSLFLNEGYNGTATALGWMRDQAGADTYTALYALPYAALTSGGNLTSPTVSGTINTIKLNTHATTAFPSVDVAMNNGTQTGTFRVGMVSVQGTRDVFFQGLPDSAAGYTVLESWQSAGLALGTGSNASPVIMLVNRIEIGRFTSTGLAITGAATATGAITSSGGGVGYATGAGGTVTQATDKATGVTLNKLSGQITLHNAALAADTTVSFTLTNSQIAATDIIVLNHVSGGTAGSYLLNAQAGAGSASINVRNITAGSLGEAIVLGFAVIKAVTA